MLVKLLVAIGLISLLIWAAIAYLGRSQTVNVKGIEHVSGDLYLIRLEAPSHLTWSAGSAAKFKLSGVSEQGESSRYLTIASLPDEGEILLITHRSGSSYKETLTQLSVGAELEMSWLGSYFPIKDDQTPLICFASDVGIAALRPIVKESSGQREIHLIHLDKGVRVFDEEMAELASQQGQLTYERIDSLSLSQKKMTSLAEKYGKDALYLLAGRPDDLEVIEDSLKEAGISQGKIKKSNFKGLD